MIMQYLDSTYTNQRDEVVCKALGLTARHERKASRDKGKYKDVKTTVYTPEERARIDEMVLTEPERIRGANTRCWDDVQVGDSIDEIARGPLSMSDTMAFVIASGRGAAHGALLRHAAKHPAHYLRNQAMGVAWSTPGSVIIGRTSRRKSACPACTIICRSGRAGLHRRSRTGWATTGCSSGCAWKHGFSTSRATRRSSPVSRQEICEGPLRARRHRNERHQSARRGELAGFATVMLPARDINTKIPIDGSVVDLDLPPIR